MRRYRPWSYRGRMTATLIACSLLATLLSLVLSLAFTGKGLRDEAVANQLRTAENMRALSLKTDLDFDEILQIAAGEDVILSEAAGEIGELSAAQRADLQTEGLVTAAAPLGNVPVTYVQLGSRTARVAVPGHTSLLMQAGLRIAISFVFFLIFFGAASLFAGARLSRPVSALSRAMRAVEDGDCSVRLPEDEPGEVGQLIHAFNSMTEALARTEFIQKDFVGSVSHEFKTPLAAIKGYVRLLQAGDVTEEDRAEYLQIIRTQTDRLTAMSQTLLRLASLEQQNQKYPSQITEFSLDEELRQAVLTLAGAWQPKEIEWEIDLRPIVIRSDRSLLAEVWANLLQNAVKFSGFGGKVRVAAFETDQAVVQVRDWGIGMDAETCKRVFDRFYQGDASHRGEGAGLGLTLAKRIVDILGGHIAVESAPGEGTMFTVTLPLGTEK